MKASELSTADLFRTSAGFMGVPWASSAKGSKAAILGAPFDCGTHAFRIGSRDGPVPSANSRGWCAPLSSNAPTMIFVLR